MMATRDLMVELMTIKTKHCREIARIIIYLFTYLFLFNKSKSVLLDVLFPSGIFGRYPFQGKIKKNDGQAIPTNMRATPTTIHRYVLMKEQLQMET